MKVLLVTPYYPPAWAYGGPTRVMDVYARGLAARGHDVVVYTTDVLDGARRSSPAAEVVEGVCVRRFRNLSNTLAWRSKKYLPPALVRELFRTAGTFDVVHVTDTRTLPVVASYLSTRRARVPLVVSAHGSLPGSTGLRGIVKRIYDIILVRPMLRQAALLLAQTDHEARLYRAEGARVQTVELLPLPIEPDLRPPQERGSFRRRLGLDTTVPLALFLGRIHPLKGLDRLVDALRADLENGRLTLAVAGRDDGQWSSVAAQNRDLLHQGAIRFAGEMYGDERFAAYGDADVFCLTPPHWEETSLASLEAAACGTGVVVSEQADLPGLTEAGGGIVVPLDAQAIRDAVAAVLADPVGYGTRAQTHVRAHHDADRVVDRLEELLAAVVANASAVRA